MRIWLIFLTLSLSLTACEKAPILGPGDTDSLASAAQADCGFVQNAYGQRVSWKSRIPVILQIHKDYPEEFITTLQAAAEHWNNAAGMTLFRFERNNDIGTNKASKNNINSIHWMNEWPEKQHNQQAVTNLYWQGNQLNEADVSVDNKYFSFFTDKASTPYEVHLESLLIHELGHVLGLKHRSTVPSVMWAVLNGASIRNVLSSADRETIKCEY